MTIDSTKYFCKRGAVSAGLNLVDTPLRGEYYYDGEHGKYYFGARYFDPFFGMWLSPDPAAQFANPYTYGGDPLNYVDPNGEAVHILVGAIIGAVVGTVNGVIQCTSAGGGSCEKAIGVGFVGGAAVGAGAAATGGLAAEAVGGGFAGAVAGGAAGGAVGGAGNYVNQSIVNGGFNSGDLWESTWKGAAAGAVGGGAGEYFGNFRGARVGGFGGGAVGSALNKEDGWSILKSGIMGAAMGGISYAASVHVKAKASYEQYEDQDPMKFFSKEALDEVYDRQLAISEKDGAFWDKQEFHIINDSQGERVGLNRYNIDSDNTSIPGPIDSDAKIIHTHDINADFREPSPGDIKS